MSKAPPHHSNKSAKTSSVGTLRLRNSLSTRVHNEKFSPCNFALCEFLQTWTTFGRRNCRNESDGKTRYPGNSLLTQRPMAECQRARRNVHFDQSDWSAPTPGFSWPVCNWLSWRLCDQHTSSRSMLTPAPLPPA